MTLQERDALKAEIRAELLHELHVPRTCRNCKFYMQHYIKDPGLMYSFTPINSGHRVGEHKRIKKLRDADALACSDFEWKTCK